MKVLVTGASGFIGSHTVGALLAEGHQVRATARSVDRVHRALRPHDWHRDVEMVAADMLDGRQVATALSGCDGVVHAAAVFSHDSRRAGEVLASNRRGTEVVLGTAAAQGLTRIVHVSSYVALLPADGWVHAGSPVGRPPTAYARSKADSELVARRLRDQGAPVTIVSPGLVFGPHDPTLGESSRLARDVLNGRVPVAVPGAIPVADVRDVAAVIALATSAAAGLHLVVVSEIMPMRTMLSILAEAAGRRPPRRTLPPWLALGIARLCDAAGRVTGTRLPMDYQSIWTALHAPDLDVSEVTEPVGLSLRPASTSLIDTVRWLQEVAEQRSTAAR